MLLLPLILPEVIVVAVPSVLHNETASDTGEGEEGGHLPSELEVCSISTDDQQYEHCHKIVPKREGVNQM